MCIEVRVSRDKGTDGHILKTKDDRVGFCWETVYDENSGVQAWSSILVVLNVINGHMTILIDKVPNRGIGCIYVGLAFIISVVRNKEIQGISWVLEEGLGIVHVNTIGIVFGKMEKVPV